MEVSLFSYEPIKSPLARIPPGLKLLVLFILIILLLHIELKLAIILFFTLIALSLLLGFSLESQVRDFRPIVIYIFFLYLVNVLINFSLAKSFSRELFIPTNSISLSMVRLLVTVQLATLFYKTTTSSQLKFSLEHLEVFLRKLLRKNPFLRKRVGVKPSMTFTFTLVIAFIPRLFSLWNQLRLAWQARGGSVGLSMIPTLFPQLLALAFSDAENTWQAILNREQEMERTEHFS